MSKHAAWHIGILPGDDDRVVRDANGMWICKTVMTWQATQIVLAANLHDDLVKALEDAGLWLGETDRHLCTAETLTELLQNIHAALAKARGAI